MADRYWEREVTARKAHRCAEARMGGRCRRTADIQPGQRYVRASGVTDGHGWARALCRRCARLYAKVIRVYVHGGGLHPEDGPTFGDLREWLRGVRP